VADCDGLPLREAVAVTEAPLDAVSVAVAEGESEVVPVARPLVEVVAVAEGDTVVVPHAELFAVVETEAVPAALVGVAAGVFERVAVGPAVIEGRPEGEEDALVVVDGNQVGIAALMQLAVAPL
jgi:hypothetical protein